jgi:hypothetical protein
MNNNQIINIVYDIINNKFNLKTKYLNRKRVEEEYTDEKREIKNILTDFINSDFLTYNENIFNLLKLIFEVFENGLNQYKRIKKLNNNDIIFVFKGGNVLRIINLNIKKNMTESIQNLIYEGYDEFLKRSDNDFSIYINPHLLNYTLIYEEIGILSFYLLDLIRSIYSNKLSEYFNLYRLNKNEINNIIYELNENINEKLNINNNKIILKKTSDKIIENDETKEYIDTYEILQNKNIFFNSLNKSLDFKDINNNIIKFDLVRTKVNFLFDNGEEVSGELIDVSIPHRDDYNISLIKNFYDFADNNFTKYLYNEDYNFYYRMINTTYIIKDLFNILFINVKFPWDDSKYQKRIYRLCYFILIDQLDNEIFSLNYIKKLIMIYKKIINNIKKTLKFKKTGFKKLDLFIFAIDDILNMEDSENKNKFINTLLINFNLIINILTELYKYIKTPKMSKNIYNMSKFA